eukprot:GHUV01023934.1.p1 GENE.GHUV01023934.1~~GHUV01023934.1.p1  ORF type:complete len:201 (-),score=49.51 GHUV01023934.1:264-866(-)
MTACCSTDDCPLNLLGGMTHGMLPLNWRAMLGDTAVRSVLAPALQFQLEPAGVASSIPAAPAQILTALAPSVTSNVTRAAIEHPAEPQQQAVVLQQPPAAAKVRRQTQQAEPEVVPRPKRVTADVVRLPGETRASMAIRQAAKDLEEAASIPLLVSQPGSPLCVGFDPLVHEVLLGANEPELLHAPVRYLSVARNLHLRV